MRLEYALTVNDPRSVMIAAIQSKSTGRSHLSKADVMTVLGICQSRKSLGLSLMYAKYTKDRMETNHALAALQLSLDQILIPCAIRSLAARKPSSLLCRASQPSQRAPQLAIPVRLLSIKPPSLAIAM